MSRADDIAEALNQPTRKTQGANLGLPDNGCERCHGHRMVLVSTDDKGHELWDRCPSCNPWPEREPVDPGQRRWWEE